MLRFILLEQVIAIRSLLSGIFINFILKEYELLIFGKTGNQW